MLLPILIVYEISARQSVAGHLPESGTEFLPVPCLYACSLPCGTLVAAWFAGCAKEEDSVIWLSLL